MPKRKGFLNMVIISNNFLKCPHVSPPNRYFDVLLNIEFRKSLNQLVGTTGFEPATPCPPDKCATKLRYAPTLIEIKRKGL